MHQLPVEVRSLFGSPIVLPHLILLSARNHQTVCLAALKLIMNSNFVGRFQTVFPIVIINLRYNIDHLVAEAFLGCYLDSLVLSQLQRLEPRRHSLKVEVLRF